MNKNPYSKYTNAVRGSELEYRKQLKNIVNMEGPSQQFTEITAPQGRANPQASEIPSVANLANLQAVAGLQSAQRLGAAKRVVRGLPSFTRSYRDYLKWRYPTRYGGRSGSGVSNPYSSATGTGSATVSPLDNIEPFPMFGGNQ